MEGELESFLSQNGGNANAYTDMEDTNYYFSITPSFDEDEDAVDCDEDMKSDALDGSLDRFAQFFICPKFDENSVERELRAIDSEYKNSIMSDSWRNYQILKSACNPNHPFGKFGCGNYETLTSSDRCSPREDLLKFWNEKYHSGNMKVCVLGRRNLDELQSLVEKHFSSVRSGEPANLCNVSDDITKKAFAEDQLSILREIKPCKAGQRITFMFDVPPSCVDEMQKIRPQRVVSHLIGHEGEGSLHQILNDDGLIHGLSCGTGVDTSDFGLFSVTIRLTKKGMKEKEKVIGLFWQWLKLIENYAKENELAPYHDGKLVLHYIVHRLFLSFLSRFISHYAFLFEELRSLSDIGYRFKENGSQVDFCSAMSENMFYYKPDELLCGAYKTGNYDHDIVQKFIGRLSPKNSIIHVWDSDFEKDDDWKVEKWYNGDYKESKLKSKDIDQWSNTLPEVSTGLRIPHLNSYIPDDFAIKGQPDSASVSSFPKKLIDKGNFRFWHKLDGGKYGVPKTYFRMHLTSPIPYSSPRSMTQARLFERLLNDLLSCEFYDAGLAGSSYGVNVSVSGINIKISGYSQKVPLLTETLFERIQKLVHQLQDTDNNILAEKYRKALESLHRETSNFNLDPPHEVANYNARLFLEESTWTIPRYLREMNEILEMDVQKAMIECGRIINDCFYSKVCRVEAICMGNVDKDEAMTLADLIEHKFLDSSSGLGDEEVPRFRAMKIPTHSEASLIFGCNDVQYPLAYEELAQGSSENNNAIELYLQVGPEATLKYEGIAILDVLGQIAYTSAFQTLRTEEQLGYIVSAFPRSAAGGSHGFSIVVQSSTKLPHELEARCEAWLVKFRNELENMTDEDIGAAASAVVSQLLERDTRLSQEVGRMWSQIVSTIPLPLRDNEPIFDRLEKLASVIDEEEEGAMTAGVLKAKILEMFDNHFSVSSPNRRALSSRVYGQPFKNIFEENTGKAGFLQGHDDIMDLKLSLETWPMRPYWK